MPIQELGINVQIMSIPIIIKVSTKITDFALNMYRM